MEQIILHKITGFKNNFPHRPIIIRDFRGILFYSTEGLSPVEKFNLPAGEYFIETGNFTKLENPVRYKNTPLPMPERIYKNPYEFSILFMQNPYKCTIAWDKEAIIFDDDFKNKPLYELYFVLYHEFGHALYNTERYADLYAAMMMRKRGYNDSQIGLASLNALSSQQFERKNFTINQILK